jgi:hypothetical protein
MYKEILQIVRHTWAMYQKNVSIFLFEECFDMNYAAGFFVVRNLNLCFAVKRRGTIYLRPRNINVAWRPIVKVSY